MKQIINGLTYNTDTADYIGNIGSDGYGMGDFKHWFAKLYRTKKGRYFMAGEGGPMSPFAVPSGNGTSGSKGIITLDKHAALSYAENDLSTDTIVKFFDVDEA